MDHLGCLFNYVTRWVFDHPWRELLDKTAVSGKQCRHFGRQIAISFDEDLAGNHDFNDSCLT